MKTLIVYTSQTGFTKRYACWIKDALDGDIITIKEATKKQKDFFDNYETIIYGGWAMAGNIQKGKWFLDKSNEWKDKKKLAMFLVGASPRDNPEIDIALENLLTEEQHKYIGLFYCQGGIDYDKMSMPYKLAMKAFAKSLMNKKNATEKEREQGEMISHSYDISDVKYIEPIVDYIVKK